MTPSIWRMGALPKIPEEIVSELQMVFEFFRFMWLFLMEWKLLVYLKTFTVVNYPSTTLRRLPVAPEQHQ
jgi:hypothetical protein